MSQMSIGSQVQVMNVSHISDMPISISPVLHQTTIELMLVQFPLSQLSIDSIVSPMPFYSGFDDYTDSH